MPPTLLIATTNPGKLREFAALLTPLDLDLRSLRDFPALPPVAEDFETYAENAAAKALAAARLTGLPALADDSGLEVDALDGAPGVHSARFAGEPRSDERNLELLLHRMRGVPAERRTARFRCVIVVVHPDGATLVAEGACEGVLLDERRGAGGFGYDPIFLHPPSGDTFAELSEQRKNAVSHRALAVAALIPQLRRFLGDRG